jgi:Oxidoreductase molybdopterin binding domain
MVLDPRLSRLRLGPFRKGAFRSRLHDERTAAILGISLGVSFGLCFATGLLSHLIQYPPSWFEWPARPAGLYRVTQGVHVAAGIASVPLLLAKLWTVYPRLWQWPPVASVLHAIERISLIPLVAGSIFLLFTGMADIGLWYPWLFFFPIAHYWAAWITIGALVIHIGAKATIARRALAHREPREESGGLTRRGLLGVAFGAAGLLTLVTIGQTLRPLNRLALLAPRRPDIGPQGFPVNKTAAGAGVEAAALAAGYRLEVVGRVRTPLSLRLDDLRALPLRTTELPIACVEGWSASVVWRGVPVRDLLTMAGAPAGASVRVESLQEGGLYRTSELNPSHAQDPDALLALDVGDHPLHIDHGYPVRFVGPNRPGVMQTKWVTRLVVL